MCIMRVIYVKGAMVKWVSIKTIAEECGVSIATVSKALNNHSDVSSATKKLVCEYCKKAWIFSEFTGSRTEDQ